MSHPQPSPVSHPLSQRRGSVAASDPFGTYASLNLSPGRTSSSTLTIVRVCPDVSESNSPSLPPSLSFQDSSSTSNGFHHSKNYSSSPIGSSFSPSQPPRLSFAASSFSQSATSTNGRAESPTSPRFRTTSPSSRRPPSATFNKPNLTPSEVYDLARQSTSPPFSACASTSPSSSGATKGSAGPAIFTHLPSSVYLPFLDRPLEVSELISSPPSSRLFSLLAQTFPGASATGSPVIAHLAADTTFPPDSATWSFTELRSWLVIPRSTAPDAVYVQNARKCIMAHSELIWERVKGALGVPPELDVDWDVEGSLLMEDGYEEDTVCDGFSNGEKREKFRRQMKDKWLGTRHDSAVITSPTSHSSSPTRSAKDVQMPMISISPILTASPSPPSSANPPPLSLGASLSRSPNIQDGMGLGDINEDAEPEEGEEIGIRNPESSECSPAEDEIVQMHGLRISTSPLPPSSPMLASSPVISRRRSTCSNSPGSRPRSFSMDTGSGISQLRSDSFGSLSPPRIVGRRGRERSQTQWERRSTMNSTYENQGGALGEVEEETDMPFDPVEERGHRSPLFPSSFAKLDPAPTLSTNDPSLRRPKIPSPTIYPEPVKQGSFGRGMWRRSENGYNGGK